ncbi:hypothetical protein CMO91_02720 [Candidatus Woesearchaeota archaeon]|jgi:hypothetical protein|nr:hypothetical protein [Candidatus Woesearchaeota archaeon]|tara:strand:- start:828 stop:1217 length:390 start_codon:yes stop_codon:yes gene_type:complete
MDFTGVIIEESLENPSVLKKVSILKTGVEKVTEKHKTPHLQQWTMHTISVAEDKAEEIAQEVSNSLDIQHAWYADFKNDAFHYVIFKNKVFKVDRSRPSQYEAVVAYGVSKGIPDYQLDFSPDIKEWER